MWRLQDSLWSFADNGRDKTKRRGLVVLGCVIIYFTFMVSPTASRWELRPYMAQVTFTAINGKTSASTEYAILTLGAATCSWWRKYHVKEKR